MHNTSFIKKIVLAASVVLLYSCDKDFNAIGEGLIGDNHFGLESVKYDVLSYNQEISPIQSNALPVNALGIYDDPVFGSTTANFVTQVSLTAYAPTIGEEPVVESVVLSVPYFSHVTEAKVDNVNIYALDSIYGTRDGKIKLSVYESGVQMRASYFDNGSQYAQMYYTDQDGDFDANKIIHTSGKPLNDDATDVGQNESFFFNPAQLENSVTGTDGKVTVSKVAPEMRLKLNKDFFQEKILNADASKLSKSDIFQEYFRGLYFKVERNGANSALALLDFTKGKIVINYKAKTAITTDPDATKEDKTLTIEFKGATASLLASTKTPEFESAVTTGVDTQQGDERLYLKGGQGSLAVIKLDNFAAKLEEIRANKWLINEANLTFHIDAEKMNSTSEPKRVYLYDLTNNSPILDYADSSTDPSGNVKLSRIVYSGIINVDATSKRGTTYKIRLTNHIRDLIKDATAKNVTLGLVVTEDINTIISNRLKLKNAEISEAPRASVMSPQGTILYGGKSTVPEGKRLQLQIYYTKPN